MKSHPVLELPGEGLSDEQKDSIFSFKTKFSSRVVGFSSSRILIFLVFSCIWAGPQGFDLSSDIYILYLFAYVLI